MRRHRVLDSRSEQAILTALRDVSVHTTTLVIAHRLSTIIDADQILVMDQGQIVERGTHRQLLAAEGLYAHLWALQQEERGLENEATLLGVQVVVLRQIDIDVFRYYPNSDSFRSRLACVGWAKRARPSSY